MQLSLTASFFWLYTQLRHLPDCILWLCDLTEDEWTRAYQLCWIIIKMSVSPILIKIAIHVNALFFRLLVGWVNVLIDWSLTIAKRGWLNWIQKQHWTMLSALKWLPLGYDNFCSACRVETYLRASSIRFSTLLFRQWKVDQHFLCLLHLYKQYS